MTDVIEKEAPAKTTPPSNVTFEIPLFARVDDGVFRKSSDGMPVFALRIGETEATLPLNGIAMEYNIKPGSPDAIMLDLVAEGLNFVKALRIGDPIPKELLTGEPSWEITASHRLLAQQRLSMQLVTWMSGEEMMEPDPTQLLAIAEDAEMQKSVNEALGAAAAELDLGNDKEKVLALIEELAEELAPIEALREKLGKVLDIRRKVQALRHIYRKEMSALEIANSVGRLMEIAAPEFTERFEEIDMKTSEIMTAMRNMADQKKYIRQQRDDLYCRLVIWDEMFVWWDLVALENNGENVETLRQSYRFLAPRFMQVDEWVLKSQASGKMNSAQSNDVKDRSNGGSGRLQTGMRW
jgi:hypothetical protein